jgi:predicted cobalt transporter CbtA
MPPAAGHIAGNATNRSKELLMSELIAVSLVVARLGGAWLLLNALGGALAWVARRQDRRGT